MAAATSFIRSSSAHFVRVRASEELGRKGMEWGATNTRSDTPSRIGIGEWRAEYETGRLSLQIAMNLVD